MGIAARKGRWDAAMTERQMGRRGHDAPVKGLGVVQIENWIKTNCLDCPYRNVAPETTAVLQGIDMNMFRQQRWSKHICLYPGQVKNVGGYCWPKSVKEWNGKASWRQDV
jgi:hypothetical protein